MCVIFWLASFSGAFAAAKRWRHDPFSDYRWKTDANWEPEGAPTASDDVIFDSSDTSTCTIEGASAVARSITISSGYTATIDQKASLTVQSTFEQLGGVFISRDPLTNIFSVSAGGSFYVTREAVFKRYGGTGTPADPFMIYDVYGLQASACNVHLSSNFKLANNIDASSTATWNWSNSRSTYEGFVPIGSSGYSGSFEGNYKVISGLYMDRYYETSVGLFGTLSSGAVISNLRISGANIRSSSSLRTGILAGRNSSGSTVQRCGVSGTIILYAGPITVDSYSGGLVGDNYGVISQSFSEGSGSRMNVGYPPGWTSAGGLVGYNRSGGSILNSYATFLSVDDGWAAGLVGVNSGDITNCYAGGVYRQYDYGLVGGHIFGYGSIVDSFFIDANRNNYAGTPVSVSQMSRESTFQGWDFGRIWSIDEDRSMPYHLWQIYSWLGSDSEWTTPSTWNLGAGYPSMESHKAFINGGSVGLNSPTVETTVGGIKIGPDFPSRLALFANMTLTNTSNKSGSLIVMSGTFEGRGRKLNIHGDIVISPEARYYPNTPASTTSGTLEFFGSSTPSRIFGNLRHYNLRCSVPFKRLTFEAGSAHTVEGSFYMSGEAGRELLLKSSVPGTRWYINPAGNVVARHIIVADSHNIGPVINTVDSYDGGNNVGWLFSAGCSVSVLTNEGGSIIPSGVLGEVTIPTSESRTFTVEASPGYYIGYLRKNGIYLTGVSTDKHEITILGSQGYHSIEAYFVRNGVRMWDGGGADNNWTTALNWTGDTVPALSDSVAFNAISGKDCLANTAVSVSNVTIEAAYSGKITQAGNFSCTTFAQYGGSLECADPAVHSFSVSGSFKIPDINGAFKRFAGSGISADPYVVYDVYGLQAVRCNRDKHFRLNNNIDASPSRNWNWNGATHEGFNPIGVKSYYSALPDSPFTGVFSGNSNRISDLWINRLNDYTQAAFGLFGHISGATITRLALSNVYVSGNDQTGGLFGSTQSGPLISECRVSGVVSGIYSGGFGGSTWNDFNAVIEKSYANVTVIGGGGTILDNATGVVRNSYSEGLVLAANNQAGGFSGEQGRYQYCYTTATNDSTNINSSGGFLGAGDPANLTECYYTDHKYYFNDLGTRRTHAELKLRASFPGWDFDNIWSMDKDGISRPYLLWSVYNWRGGSSGGWTNADNWNKELEKASDYPRTKEDKVFLSSTGESLSTPAAGLVLGELRLGSAYTGILTLGGSMLLTNEAGKGGNLVILGGTVEAGSRSISIEGDFIRKGLGRFLSGTGTVEILGRDTVSTLVGSKTLNNLLCRTPGKVISFESGSVHTVEGAWSVSGEGGSNGLIKLSGTRNSPEVWYINPSGSRNLKNLIVSNSYNIGANLITPESSYDGGNNYRWDGFVGYLVNTSANQGGTISPLGDSPVIAGEKLEVTVTASDGHYIGFIKIDGIPTAESLVSPKTLYISGDKFHSVEAYFAPSGIKVWTGNGVTSNWSDPVNWTGNATPAAGERVVFDSTSSKASIINSFGTGVISGLSIESTSTVVLTQTAPVRITGAYRQSSSNSRYICTTPGSAPLTVEGDFIIPTNYNVSSPPFFRLGGAGSSGSPYTIYDVYGLQGLINLRDANYYYKLMGDIDAYPTRSWRWNGTTHEGFVPFGENNIRFDGRIDGNYYSIKGLRINRPLEDYVSLLGYSWAEGVSIKDLTMTDVSIVGRNYVGAISGHVYLLDSGASNVYIQGYVSGESQVGGFYGYASSNGINRGCVFRGEVSGVDWVGGISGYNASLVDCYSDAYVKGRSSVGGLSGYTNYTTIRNCYFSGNVSGNSSVGGLIGRRDYAGVENSYFLNPAYDNGIGTLVSESNLKSRAFLRSAGWDLGRTWGLDEGRGYPYLQHEKWLWIGGGGSGDWTNSANWNKRSGWPNTSSDRVFINTVEAAFVNMPATNINLSRLQLGSDFNKVLEIGANLSLVADADNEGSVYIYNGVLDANGFDLSIGGNFYKGAPGAFSREASTVVFVNSSYPSAIEGNTTFNNLSCSTQGKMISFEAGAIQTIEGVFLIGGSSASKVNLRSMTEGVTWEINPVGSRSVNYVNVRDSRNISIEDISAGNSVNYGNNSGWIFTNHAVQVFAGPRGRVNTMEGTFYVDTSEGGSLTFFVSPESTSYYISDVRINGVSTTDALMPGTKTFTISNITGFNTFEASFVAFGEKIWKGGGSTHKWSDPLNWSGNTTPWATDRIIFNGTSTKISTIDSDFIGVVAGVSIESGYTGIIRQNRSLAINGNYRQNSGAFVCVNPNIPTLGAFSVSGSFSIPTNEGAFIRYTGSGASTSSAYVIYDIYGLQAMKCNLNKYFRLDYNISGTQTFGWNWNSSLATHEGFDPIGGTGYPFTGSLDGRTFTVSGLNINRATRDYIGLFGVVGTGANIYNLGLSGSSIRGQSYSGSIVGHNAGGTFSNCFSKGNILNFSSGGYQGGFAGHNASVINNSYAGNRNDTVLPGMSTGNFVGYNSGNILNSYTYGSSRSNYASGFVGGGSNVTNCYYATYESGRTGSNLGAQGLSPIQMKKASSFSGWDFDNTWTIDEDNSYPYLVIELYNWIGEAPNPFWTSPLNWNKKTSYPASVNDKVYINKGSQTILTPPGDMYLGSLIFGPEFSGFVSLNGDLYLGQSSTIEGSLLLLGGTLAANTRNIYIDGRFKRGGGGFAWDDVHTVIFTGSGRSLIEGNTVFYSLYCTKEGKSLIFEAGSVQTVEGTLRISAETSSGGKIALRSTVDGSYWYINPSGTVETVFYADVKDSVNLRAQTINPYYSKNSGNTVNWFSPFVITSEVSKVGIPDARTWGTIEPFGLTEVYHGDSQKFTITPMPGFYISNIRVDGRLLNATSEYQFDLILSYHTIEAMFAIRPFLLTSEVTGNGSGSINPLGKIEAQHYSKRIFTVEADAGSYIAFVKIDGKITSEGLSNPSVYPQKYFVTFESVENDHTIEAYIADNTLRIWTGNGETEYWSEADNWTGGVTPDANSFVIFNSTGTKDAVIDASFPGSIRAISMESGYPGEIEIGRVFTVEGNVSIESGSLYQNGFDMYVRGDFYSTFEAGGVPGFYSEGGTVFFDRPSGVQYLKVFVDPFSGIGDMFYNLNHTGGGTLRVSAEGALWIDNDFHNISGAGTCEVFHTFMIVGGGFTNESIFKFTPDWSLPIEDGFFGPFSSLNTMAFLGPVINTSGTEEGKEISAVMLVAGNTVLEAPLKTLGLVLLSGFDASGHNVHVSSILSRYSYYGNANVAAVLDIVETDPDTAAGLFPDFYIYGNMILRGLQCKVPGKKIIFTREYGICSIEETGFVTFEGGLDIPDYISLVATGEGAGRWLFDPRCPASNRTFYGLYVQDSHNISGLDIEATNSLDGENNIGWIFTRYRITATANTGGTIDPAGTVFPERGSDVTYVVTADPGYYIGYILKDGLPVTDGDYVSPYWTTFEGVTSGHTIEAYFDRIGGRTWTGQGVDNNWSTPANWSGNQVPIGTDAVLFNATSSKEATIDTEFGPSIEAIFIEYGYSGTITQARSLVVTATFEQAGGTFVSPPQQGFTVEGSFYVADAPVAFNRFDGLGTGGSPYAIYDIYGLQAMKGYLGAYFVLNNDISGESTAFWNPYGDSSYRGFDPVGDDPTGFTGSLDGNGRMITGLRIDRAQDNVGLFGVLGIGSEVTQVGIVGVSIEAAGNAGILAGTNYGSISKVYSLGFIKGTGTDIGGIAGSNFGTISYSYSVGTAEGGTNVGGLVGNVAAGSVTESYADVEVSGSSIGGLAGISSGTVERGHFTGADNSIGSFETSAQIKQRARFVGWDFDRTWTIDGGKSRPQLMWEIYTWTGSADGTSWTNPNNWNKKSGYPQTREHKAYINSGVSIGTPVGQEMVLGGLQLGPDYTGTLSLGNNILLDNAGSREGNLILSGGQFNRGNNNVVISGDLRKSAAAGFTNSPGQTILTGEAPSYIEGDITYRDLVCRAPGKRLTFEAGSQQIVTGVLSISGEAGRWVTLESNDVGTQFGISAETRSIYFVSVKDSTNESGTVINPSGSNLNLGNTSRWFTYRIYATAEENGSITPSGTTEVVITSPDFRVAYQITAEAGYYIASVEVDGVNIGRPSVHTFESVMANHVISVFVTTDATPMDPPRKLRVNISGNDIVLSWEAVYDAASYNVYRSANRFVPLQTWEKVASPASSTWTDAGRAGLTTEAYYFVRAWNTGGEGPESSMGAYKKLGFAYNESPVTNDNRIGLPYTTSLGVLRDIVVSIEGGTGPNTNQKINSVAVWNAGGQNYTTFAYVHPIGWLGAAGDTVIEAGSGINIILSGNSGNFSWEAGGVDREDELSFTYNDTPPILTNDNRIGLPYTTSLGVLRDIVVSIEGGTGPNTNQKINSVAVWNAGGQNYTTFAYVHPIGWLGAAGDTVIEAGAGINIILSGNTTAFDWPQELVIDPKE